MLGTSKFLFVGLGILLLLFGGYFYWSQNEISNMNKNLGELKVQLETQTESINDYQNKVRDLGNRLDQYQIAIVDIRKRSSALSNKIDNLNLNQDSKVDKIGTQKQVNDTINGQFRNITVKQ